MDYFPYRNRTLHCEDRSIPDLVEKYGTPLYIYSQKAFTDHLHEIQTAFAEVSPLICYSVKSNANLSICRLMHKEGSGFDVTSAGELYRALQSGGTGEQMVFAGAGKTNEEIRYGLDNDVLLFNVESEAELSAVAEVAQEAGKVARVALRVNPALPPKTHVKTDTSVKGTKFGLDIDSVLEFAGNVVKNPHVKVQGLHMHLGSPILSAQPYQEGIDKGAELIRKMREQGHNIEYINMGGGFGINYLKQEALPASAFAAVIIPKVKELGCKLILEPGRFIAGNAGILVSRVIFTKESGGKQFIIQDAAMNDLIRPTLYESFHRVWPVIPADGFPTTPDDYEQPVPDSVKVDVVGPVCESGDFLAKDRPLPPMKRGDLLATFSAGAYGMAMASNYNGRLRAAEVLVDGSNDRLIRRRETFEDLVRTETEIP